MSKLSPEGKALVEAGRGALRPTAADRQRVLDSLRARLGTGEGPLPDAAPPAPAAAAGGGLGWPAISGLIAGAALLGGLLSQVLVESSGQAQPRLLAPALAIDLSRFAPAGRVEVSEEAPVSAPATPPEPASSLRGVGPRGATGSLADEVALLSRAETELHSNRFSSALRMLDDYERKFPRGALVQEDVAARVRALCGLGRLAQAKQQLSRLSPGSPHASRARAACGAGKLD